MRVVNKILLIHVINHCSDEEMVFESAVSTFHNYLCDAYVIDDDFLRARGATGVTQVTCQDPLEIPDVSVLEYTNFAI